MQTFSYEPSAPPTIPAGMTCREYRQRTRGRRPSPWRRRARRLLGRPSRAVWR